MLDSHALIDPGAEIGSGVAVGAFSTIGPEVEIGDGTWVGPHVVITGKVRIGQKNKIHQFCSIGDAPQHLGYRDEPTAVEIGSNNIIREYCTINRGTALGRGVTKIGNNNFLMAYVHIAHDCTLGDHTIFANCASLAGHVEVGDYAVLGGFTLVHQYCRVGEHCITGIGAVCLKDVPPYVLAAGNRAKTHGINVKGLRRRGFTDQSVHELRLAYRVLFRSGLKVDEAIENLRQDYPNSEHIQALVTFLKSSTRGVIR